MILKILYFEAERWQREKYLGQMTNLDQCHLHRRYDHNHVVDLINELRGVVYMLKRIGPRTEPWGTPHDRGTEDDVVPDAFTEKEREDR